MKISAMALLLFFCQSVLAQSKTMTLKECIEVALKNNILVKQTALQADAATVNLQQAKANMLPSVNANVGYGFNQGRNVDPLTNNYINQQLSSSNLGLNSELLLFNGMRIQNLVGKSKFDQQASKLDLQQSKNDLTLNVILNYLQVLSNEDVLAINRSQEAATRKQVDRMLILVKEGVNANYLLAELQGQLASDEIAILNASNAQQVAKLNLCQLMNIPYDPSLQLEKEAADFPVDAYAGTANEVYEKSLQEFPSIQANNYRIKSAEKSVQVFKSGYFPLISLNANLGSSYSSLAQTLSPLGFTEVPTGSYVKINGGESAVLTRRQEFSAFKTSYTTQLNNNLGNYVGINMRIPLFNSFQTKYNVKLAKTTLQNTRLESENDKLLLRQSIEQAWLNTTTAYDKYQVLTKQLAFFEEAFRAAEVRFNSGVINAAEYLISKNNLDRARITLAQAKYEYSFRTRVLDYYKGL